jgi:hypothetical protein
VRVRDPHAKRYRSRYFLDKAEGERWAKTLRPRLQTQLDSAAPARLRDIGDSYLDHLRAADRSEGHIRHTEVAIESAIEAGITDLNDPRCPDIAQRWLSRLVGKRWGQRSTKPAAPRTRNHYLVSLQAIARYAIKRRWLLFNPFDVCTRFREPKRERGVFTAAELKLIVGDTHRTDPWWLFAVFVAACDHRSRDRPHGVGLIGITTGYVFRLK